MDSDVDNLVTGSGSFMFENEKLAQRQPEVVKKDAERKRQESELRPIANDLLAEFARDRAGLSDIRSYIAQFYDAQQKVEIENIDILIEFRAREMMLKFIDRYERWVKNRLRRSQ